MVDFITNYYMAQHSYTFSKVAKNGIFIKNVGVFQNIICSIYSRILITRLLLFKPLHVTILGVSARDNYF